jgi:hypothetical protein
MTILRRPNTDGERGATLVEFALIAPLLFLMLGSMLDIGLAVLGSSVASNAAREGARHGIIHFEDADVVGSTNYDAITNAVDTKLVGLVSPDASLAPYVEVQCLDGITKAPLDGTGTCARSEVQIDHDLIEVTVKWTSIAPGGSIFVPDTFVDRARMVIIGDGGGTGSAPCGFGGTIDFAPTSASVTETDSGTTLVTLTVTRSTSTCTTTVAYATANGSATGGDGSNAGDDYATTSSLVTFLNGQMTDTFTIEIFGDSDPEPNETFTVALSNPVNGTIGAGTATVTIVNDDVSSIPPGLTGLQMFDDNTNGKIDRITATFDEPLQTTCPTPGAVTFPTNGPQVQLRTPVTFSGTVATFNLNEGPVFDTSNASLTVALAPNCIRDVDGNSATFGATTPSDGAFPVLVTVGDSDPPGGTDGLFEQGNWVDFTFSEPLDPSTLPAAAGNVVVIAGNGNQNDTLQIANLLFGDIDLNRSDYIGGNNTSATFPNATIGLTSNVIRVTLVNGCGCTNLTTSAGASNVTFAFVANLHALDGRSIPPKSISTRLF